MSDADNLAEKLSDKLKDKKVENGKDDSLPKRLLSKIMIMRLKKKKDE